jgi:prolyl-tRNA synthetase
VVVRRDNGEKQTVKLDELETLIPALLETIQKDMLEKARAHRDAHTYAVENYEQFKDTIENRPGFIKAMWCGDRACEDAIKEETGATARCMPFKQECISDKCVYCGREAKKMVYFGRAY